MSTKKLISNTIYFGIIPKLSTLINVVLLPFITPYLTTFDYGVQGVLFSYSNLIAMIAPLGLHVHLSNSYYEYPNRYQLVWGRVLFVFIVSGLLFGIVNIAILLFILPLRLSPELFFLSIVGSFHVIFFANSLMAANLFPLEGNPKPLVFTNLFSSLVGIAVSFVLIYFFRLGYWGLVSTIAVTTIISYLLYIKFVWINYHIRPIIEHNLKRFKRMLRIGLPLIPHTMGFVLLANSSRIIMSIHHVPYDDIGLYSHGYSMGDQIVVITSALVIALTPQNQLSYRSGDFAKYRKLFLLCQSFALVSSFIFCIWMPEIYSLLIKNDKLAESSSIASLTCFANVVYPLYVYMSYSAFIEKRTPQVLWIVFFPGILNLILCYIFIPIYGYKAAIYSTMISYWSQIFIPFFVPYFKERVTMWLGSRKRLVVDFGCVLTVTFLANLVNGFSAATRLLITFIVMSLFGVEFYRRKIYSVL